MKALAKVMGVVLVLGFCIALAWNDASAQVIKGKTPAKTDPAASADLLTAPLFPPDTIAKLKLTAEQKTEYATLVKEFDEQLKKLATAPTTGGTTTPPKTKGLKGTKGGTATPATPAAQAITLRAEYEDKVEKLLTDAQKTVLENIRVAKAGNLFGNPTPKK